MDLLDSILKGMEKPPTIKKPVIKDKEKREKLEKLQKQREDAIRKQKESFDKFRNDLSKKLKTFVDTPTTNDPKTFKMELKPMDKIYRAMIHEVSEDFEDDIVVYSFGKEDEDRHCVIWKKGFEPSDIEIRAMKLGIEHRLDEDGAKSDEEEEPEASGSNTVDGKDRFRLKYEKIIGENAAGVESAKVALPAKQYGCVPVENKKDLRSIEQILEDKRKTKRQKISDEEDKTKD